MRSAVGVGLQTPAQVQWKSWVWDKPGNALAGPHCKKETNAVLKCQAHYRGNGRLTKIIKHEEKTYFGLHECTFCIFYSTCERYSQTALVQWYLKSPAWTRKWLFSLNCKRKILATNGDLAKAMYCLKTCYFEFFLCLQKEHLVKTLTTFWATFMPLLLELWFFHDLNVSFNSMTLVCFFKAILMN